LLYAINFDWHLFLERIYLDNIWVILKNFAHSEFLLGTVDLVSVLIRFKHFDAYGFVSLPFCQVYFGMHSVTDLLDCLDIALLTGRLTAEVLWQLV
jgi:hypothetical protein